MKTKIKEADREEYRRYLSESNYSYPIKTNIDKIKEIFDTIQKNKDTSPISIDMVELYLYYLLKIDYNSEVESDETHTKEILSVLDYFVKNSKERVCLWQSLIYSIMLYNNEIPFSPENKTALEHFENFLKLNTEFDSKGIYLLSDVFFDFDILKDIFKDLLISKSKECSNSELRDIIDMFDQHIIKKDCWNFDDPNLITLFLDINGAGKDAIIEERHYIEIIYRYSSKQLKEELTDAIKAELDDIFKRADKEGIKFQTIHENLKGKNKNETWYKKDMTDEEYIKRTIRGFGEQDRLGESCTGKFFILENFQEISENLLHYMRYSLLSSSFFYSNYSMSKNFVIDHINFIDLDGYISYAEYLSIDFVKRYAKKIVRTTYYHHAKRAKIQSRLKRVFQPCHKLEEDKDFNSIFEIY